MNTEPELLNERLERLAIVLDEIMPQCALLVRDAIDLLKEQEDLGTELTNAVELIHKKNERIEKLLKEQEAVEPKVSGTEQRCGHCNYVIEMDGWKSCPWCGKMIDWEKWWNKNGTHDNTCRKEERSVK